ncbi:unnamed protein product [Camellia sinensis]
MENGEHQAITITESDSNQELPVRSTNEIEESTNVASVIHMQRRLNEIRREGIQNLKERQNAFICKVPQSLIEIGSPRDIEPEIVSIGPYHHSKDGVLEFESYKWQFLHTLLSQTNQPHAVHLRQAMKKLEREARTWYSEPIEISSEQFIEMMMLDEYHPLSDQSMPRVTRLRLAGIKFRPQKIIDGSFLDINFHKGVLEIPPITINDFTSTILINVFLIVEPDPGHTKLHISKEGLEAIQRITTPIGAVAGLVLGTCMTQRQKVDGDMIMIPGFLLWQ